YYIKTTELVNETRIQNHEPFDVGNHQLITLSNDDKNNEEMINFLNLFNIGLWKVLSSRVNHPFPPPLLYTMPKKNKTNVNIDIL
ncbi:unnamed protein product, partial [Schistosoma turkestanicum]